MSRMESADGGAFALVRVGFLWATFLFDTFFLEACFGAAFLAVFFFAAFRVEGRLRAVFFPAVVFFLRAALRVFFLAAIPGPPTCVSWNAARLDHWIESSGSAQACRE